jgi:hypothetical protein
VSRSRLSRLCLALVAAGVSRLAAQGGGLSPAAAISVVQTRVRSELPGRTDQFTGAALGGQGSVSLGRLDLSVSYVQGKIDPVAASGPGHDLVEGSMLLGIHPTSWLRLATGPHARAYALTGGTQRWVFWELRLRAAGAFIGSAARGYVELWRALSASVNVPEPFDHAQGGEAGMVVHLARAPLDLRLAYRIDHAVLGGGTRLETVDGVVVAVGLSGVGR